jgi:hypothetical protein
LCSSSANGTREKERKSGEGGKEGREESAGGKVQGRASRSHRLKVGVYAWNVSEEWNKVNVRTNISGDS